MMIEELLKFFIDKLKQYKWVKQIFHDTNKRNILELKTGNLSDGSLQPSREEGCTTFFFWQYFQKNGWKKFQTKFKDFLGMREGPEHIQKISKLPGLASIYSSVGRLTSPKVLWVCWKLKKLQSNSETLKYNGFFSKMKISIWLTDLSLALLLIN